MVEVTHIFSTRTLHWQEHTLRESQRQNFKNVEILYILCIVTRLQPAIIETVFAQISKTFITLHPTNKVKKFLIPIPHGGWWRRGCSIRNCDFCRRLWTHNFTHFGITCRHCRAGSWRLRFFCYLRPRLLIVTKMYRNKIWVTRTLRNFDFQELNFWNLKLWFPVMRRWVRGRHVNPKWMVTWR